MGYLLALLIGVVIGWIFPTPAFMDDLRREIVEKVRRRKGNEK